MNNDPNDPTRGTNLPLNGRGYTTSEGAFRVPTIMWWPSVIPAATVSHELSTTMDLLPTFAKLSGGSIPQKRIIDGHDIRDLIHGVEGATSPTEAFYYYQRTQLQAVRSGPWKLHLPRKVDEKWAHYSKSEDVFDVLKPMLFNLKSDLSETTDISAQHPGVVKNLLQLAEQGRSDIGDIDRIGENARFFDDDPKRPDINGDKQ